MAEINKSRGGVQSRIGYSFHSEIEKIIDARLLNGKSKDRVSIEKITNLIVRHKDAWSKIKLDIINAGQEEIDMHGK